MINIINILIIIIILVGSFFLLKYKKLETLAILAALKAESISMISGSKKLEYAVEWLYSQKLFKDSFLSFIPKKTTKYFIDFIFRQKKALIEKESKSGKF